MGDMLIWCNCPYVSETTLMIPYVYVPPAVVVKMERAKNAPLTFDTSTMFSFTLGWVIVILTSFFLVCMGVGAGFDMSK
jgi:hypothetical protein